MIKPLKCEHCRREKTGGHYSISELTSIDDIKGFFPEGKANSVNWLIASTSGVHGTYTTLDEIEKTAGDGEDKHTSLTVQVIMPRLCRYVFGDIEISCKEDADFIRGLIKSSLEEIAKSQEGNV